MFERAKSQERIARSAVQYVAGETCLQSLANMLSLARCNVYFDDADVARATNELAALADQCKLSPDEIAEALYLVDPALRFDWEERPPDLGLL